MESAKLGINPVKSLPRVFYFLDSGMSDRVGTQVKCVHLRVASPVGYGLSAAKEKTSIAYIFLRGIPTSIRYTPRNKPSRLSSHVVLVSGVVQPGGKSGGKEGFGR